MYETLYIVYPEESFKESFASHILQNICICKFKYLLTVLLILQENSLKWESLNAFDCRFDLSNVYSSTQQTAELLKCVFYLEY